MDIAALRTELQTDPQALGYAPHVASGNHTALRKLINEPGLSGETITVTSLSVEAIKDAIVYSEMLALNAQQRDTLIFLLQGSQLNLSNNVKQAFADLFGAGTTSRSNLQALATRPASRAEALFDQSVSLADIGAALME